MTMYASVTAEHFDGTIEYECRVHGLECYGCVYEREWEVPFQQHNEPNPILVKFRESTLSLDVWLTHLTTSGRMQHGTFMTGTGTPPLCSCGWQGKNHTGPILAEHQREARKHVDHARRVLTRLAALA